MKFIGNQKPPAVYSSFPSFFFGGGVEGRKGQATFVSTQGLLLLCSRNHMWWFNYL